VVVSGPAYVAVSDPASGATDLLFSGAPLTAGDGVAIDPMGDVLVADSGSGAIHRIDAETGVASVVASGGSLLVPNRIVVGPDGTIYVVDVGLGGAIVAVNPDTGASAVLAVVPDAFDLAIDRAGSALHVAAGDAVVRVALPGGSQSVLASGGLMSVNLGIGVEAGGDLVVLTYVNGTFTHRLVRVSADGSTQTALHTSAPNTGYYDLALDGEGAALVADAGGNAAVRVDLATGIAETVDALEFPFGVTAVLPRCDDGLDNDADGAWDAAGAAADAGCTGPADPWEFELGRTCDDGLDNDGDGWEDFRIDGSGDPGCRLASSATENPQCQDGIDNDGKPGIDFDGGASRNGGVPLADPDPQCTEPWRTRERASGCGLGFELALLLPLLGRRRRAA
jgi:streptogramin lyase